MSFLKGKNITPVLTYPRVDFSAVGGDVGNQKTEVPSPSLFPWYLELGSHRTDSFRILKLLFKTCGDSVGNPVKGDFSWQKRAVAWQSPVEINYMQKPLVGQVTG